MVWIICIRHIFAFVKPIHYTRICSKSHIFCPESCCWQLTVVLLRLTILEFCKISIRNYVNSLCHAETCSIAAFYRMP